MGRGMTGIKPITNHLYMYSCNYNMFATHHSRIGGGHGNSEQCLIGKNKGYLNSGTFGSVGWCWPRCHRWHWKRLRM
jgi:hypothetical protein